MSFRLAIAPTLAAAVLALAVPAPAEEPPRDRLIYVEQRKDAVLEEMRRLDDERRAASAAATADILARVKAEQKARADARRELRVDMSGIARPAGPDAFATRSWHLPPVPQYRTGTCWSFATTSFMESEIHRLSGREIKLSEMWAAYWEYVAKARGFVAARGESLFAEGSQAAALLRAYSEHGAVPRSAYEGVLAADGRFDHDLMERQMSEFLDWCRDAGFWDESVIVGTIRAILDLHMGRPPETVVWEGVEMSPQAFLAEVCGLDPADYVGLISTLALPFWSRGPYDVPDNWWHDASYLNLPLEDFYGVIRDTVAAGGSVVFGGDVSEPGLWGLEDIAVVPSFDIPGALIDQDAREFRFVNESSTDDHLVHAVGLTELDGRDWFLIKDSNRSSRAGKHEGYYFFRDDYVKLKMLTATVHRDRLAAILERVAVEEH